MSHERMSQDCPLDGDPCDVPVPPPFRQPRTRPESGLSSDLPPDRAGRDVRTGQESASLGAVLFNGFYLPGDKATTRLTDNRPFGKVVLTI